MEFRRHLPPAVLWVGIAVLLVSVPLAVRHGVGWKELPWVAGAAAFPVAALIVWRRRSDEPIAAWFAVTGGLVALVQGLDGQLQRAVAVGEPSSLAWVILAFNIGLAIGGVAIAHLIGLFPTGRPERAYEARLLRSLWLVLLLPPLVFIARPTLLLPSYHMAPTIPNPYHLPVLAPIGTVAGVAVTLLQGVFVIGVVLLVSRYRRATTPTRRRIRWLLLPALVAAAVAVIDSVAWRTFPGGSPSLAAELALTSLWILAIASLPTAIAFALLRPGALDIDRVIRRSLVYGVLWLLIAAVYVAAAAGLGLAAGQRMPVEVAITLAVIAAVLFHPARQRLERLADRRVFGPRPDPSHLVASLGQTLERTFDLEALLPRMAGTLEEGLGLRWARVRLDADPDGVARPASPADPIRTAIPEGEEPALRVPVTLGREHLGVVECGPKRTGTFTTEDQVVIETFARQAALAVRNLRLTRALAAQADELAASRTRLVRAQEHERRRIERNIHDGAQQHLVALASQAAHVRSLLERESDRAEPALDELQAGLRQVIRDLRELAHGIHPSILSDRGLLDAVEALAARSPVPVVVRADPALRGQRFSDAAEGAGYFTVAESLANAGKHAGATTVEVRLDRVNGFLRIDVRDDGVGFDPATVTGEGLRNLAERLSALGGDLRVDSAPGRGATISATVVVERPATRDIATTSDVAPAPGSKGTSGRHARTSEGTETAGV
jgi:signal transduction histidine kinase